MKNVKLKIENAEWGSGLLTACKNLTLLILILHSPFSILNSSAVSISSPKIGTFFDLNNMVPDSVPADRTFGSDDATNMTHRLDPQEQAAVNANFEAACERAYYSSAGNSNRWEIGTWGGVRADENFRFGIGTRGAFWQPDTNRVIRTRRLVDGDNICALSERMLGTSPDWTFFVRRPGWTSNDAPYWSSSSFTNNATYGGELFPSFDWTSMSKSRWEGQDLKHLALTFDDCPQTVDGKPPSVANWVRNPDDELRPITRDALKSVGFGEPWMSDPDVVGPAHQMASNRVEDVIGSSLVVTNLYTEDIELPVYAEYQYIPETYSRYCGLWTLAMYQAVRQFADRHEYAGSYGIISLSSDGSGLLQERGWYFVYGYANGFNIVRDDGVTNSTPSTFYGLGFYVAKESDLPKVIGTPKFYRRPDITLPISVSFRGTASSASGVPDSFSPSRIELGKAVFTVERTNLTHTIGFELMTNQTYRLVRDQLDGQGLTLASLDRTYRRVSPTFPETVSNFEGFASCEAHCQVVIPSGSLDWWVDGGSIHAGIAKELMTLSVLSVDDPIGSVATNAVSRIGLPGGSAWAAHASPASLDFDSNSYDFTLGDGPVMTYAELQREVGDIALPPNRLYIVDIPDVSFVSGLSILAWAYIRYAEYPDWFAYRTYFTRPFTFPASITADVYADLYVDYTFRHSFGGASFEDPTYPGDFSRAMKTSLWDLQSIGISTGYGTNEVYDATVSYSPLGGFSASYRSGRMNPTTANQEMTHVRSQFASLSGESLSRFRNQTSAFDPVQFASRFYPGMKNALRDLDLDDGNVISISPSPLIVYDPDPIPPGRYMRGFYGRTDGNGRLELTNIIYGPGIQLEPYPSSGEFQVAALRAHTSISVKLRDEYSPVGFHGLSVNSKYHVLSGVDWDWHALKLERNNQ